MSLPTPYAESAADQLSRGRAVEQRDDGGVIVARLEDGIPNASGLYSGWRIRQIEGELGTGGPATPIGWEDIDQVWLVQSSANPQIMPTLGVPRLPISIQGSQPLRFQAVKTGAQRVAGDFRDLYAFDPYSYTALVYITNGTPTAGIYDGQELVGGYPVRVRFAGGADPNLGPIAFPPLDNNTYATPPVFCGWLRGVDGAAGSEKPLFEVGPHLAVSRDAVLSSVFGQSNAVLLRWLLPLRQGSASGNGVLEADIDTVTLGKRGVVPAPLAADVTAGKYLGAPGQWEELGGPGAGVLDEIVRHNGTRFVRVASSVLVDEANGNVFLLMGG